VQALQLPGERGAGRRVGYAARGSGIPAATIGAESPSHNGYLPAIASRAG